MLFLKSKRVFALVLQTESRHFQIHEDKANAHAGMPFSAYLGLSCQLFGWFTVVSTNGNSPFGAWVVCVYRVEAV